MRSKIFTKFKCNNAHAYAFRRKTLPVSVFIFISSSYIFWPHSKSFIIVRTDAEHAKKLSPTAQRSQSISEFTAAKSHISANCAYSGKACGNAGRRINQIEFKLFFIQFCRFSQSGNLNRHMRVHGTNAMITWQRQISRADNFIEIKQSREYQTSFYSSATSISCAEEFQRRKQDSYFALYRNNYSNIF